jgi:hypothetical protein
LRLRPIAVGWVAAACSIAAWAAACADEPGPKPEICPVEQGVGQATSAIKAADRKIIGEAADYPASMTLRAEEDALARSQRLRREVAWEIVAKVLSPVELAEPALEERPTVPLWRTWYGKDDVERMFDKLYVDLGSVGRKAHADFPESALDNVFAWNAHAVEELESWPDERYLAYVSDIEDDEDVQGIGGMERVGYSPSAVRHVLEGYNDVLGYLDGPEPPALAEAPEAPAPITVHRRGTVAECASSELGPFVVGQGQRLTATMRGTGDADLFVKEGGAPSATDYDCRPFARGSEEECTLEGPGLFYVTVRGYEPASDFELEVRYAEGEDGDFAPGLGGELPIDAALVKASWHRAELGEVMPTYDTSAERTEKRLEGAADWGQGDGFADPGRERIYTLRLPNDNRFRLAGMHIITKELRHWMWITLWWSDDPDSDFGADRPDAIRALGGPWANYKMCVVSSYDERDPDPTGGFGADAPSLAAALAAVYAGEGGPSWCSNPYLEEGAGNAATNCIGCHQHAGTSLEQEQIFSELPHNGRSKLRNNFPLDYLWALTDGDALAYAIAAKVAHYDSFE